MTNIEQKAMTLLKECVGNAVWKHPITQINREANLTHEALCRAIEQHEAFRQEVSDVAASALAMYQRAGEGNCPTTYELRRFIIAKPDPLVEAIREMALTGAVEDDADRLRTALAKRGLEIREKSE